MQNELNELMIAAEKLIKFLNEYSDEIRSLESALGQTLNLVFKYKASSDISLYWQECSLSKKFRLFVLYVPTEEFVPLITTNLELRFECRKYLPGFIKGYTECINNFLQDFKEK